MSNLIQTTFDALEAKQKHSSLEGLSTADCVLREACCQEAMSQIPHGHNKEPLTWDQFLKEASQCLQLWNKTKHYQPIVQPGCDIQS